MLNVRVYNHDNAKLPLKVKLHIAFCQKENKEYILQDCGGGHFGFMHE